MTVQSLRTRTLLVIPIRLGLGVVWLVAARLAGSGQGPALLAFVGRRARDRVPDLQRSAQPLRAGGGRAARTACGRANRAAVAPGARVRSLPSTVGVSVLAAIAVATRPTLGGAARRRLRRPRTGGTHLADPRHAGAVRRPEDARHLPRAEGRNSRTKFTRDVERGSNRSATAAVSRRAHYATRVQDWRLTELDSGERVISERLDHVRSAAVGYWIGAGSRDEQAGEAGVTHFIEHLLFKGSDRFSALQIAEIFDGLGGELNAATSREHTLVYARVPDHHLATAMDVMSDMVFSPSFAELDSERDVVLEEIAMYDDAPQELVHDLIADAVFADHPLGRPVIGTAEVISSIPRESIARYHDDDVRPGEHRRRGGRQPRARRDRRARDARARTVAPARPAAGPNVRPPLVQPPPPRLRFQRKDTEQYHVCLAAPGISRSDRRRFAASLLDAILGGSASSRLFQEIREKRGMAYAVYSFVSQYTDTGPDRHLPRHPGGQPRRRTRDRRRADRRRRRRQHAGNRAGAREGEPEGPDPALDGVDLDADEPARQVADHRLGAALARPDRRRDRRGRGVVGRRAGRDVPRAGAAFGCVHRPERGTVPGGARADHADARPRRVKLLLNGRSGKVGSVLAPALEAQGHELVDSLDDAEAMVDFTDARRRARERRRPRSLPACPASSERAAGTPRQFAMRRSQCSTRRTSRSARC